MRDEATATVDYEKRYLDTQGAYTKGQQELAEARKQLEQLQDLQRRVETGELMSTAERDRDWQDHLAEQARENPNQLLAEFGLAQPAAASDPVAGLYPGFDSTVLDQNSEQHKAFIEEHGRRAYETAYYAVKTPELLRATGLDRRMEEHERLIREQQETIARLEEQGARSTQYSEAAWSTAREVSDPIVKTVRELQKPFREDAEKAWRQLAADRAELEALRERNGSRTQRVPAEQQAARMREAYTVPASAGVAAGASDSRSADPWEAAVQRARQHAPAR